MSDKSNPQGRAEAERAQRMANAAHQAAIRLRAYYRAERRGFAPGHELEDWVMAEEELTERDAANASMFDL